MKTLFLAVEVIVSDYLPLTITLVTGLIFSLKTSFFQFRKLGFSVKYFFKPQKAEQGGKISSFQAACTSLASTIGTGNIVGVATAISMGGPGAVFWMVISAFFSMIIKLFEILLSVKFSKNSSFSGPMTYLAGLFKNTNILPILFAVFCVFSSFAGGNITQVNTIAFAVSGEKNIRIFVGIIVGVLVLLILSGGIKRIAIFSEIAVPIMSVLYIVFCLGVIAVNYKNFGGAIKEIIIGAFNPAAVTSGAVGSLFITAGIGASRGIFSNEAGTGTTAFAHSECENDAASEGLYGIFEVFFDTVVMCSITGIAIVSAKIPISYGKIMSSNLVTDVFKDVYGSFSAVIISAMLVVFGFTSTVGWGYYGIKCAEYLNGNSKKIYLILYAFCCFLGAVCSVSTAWRLAGFFNGIILCLNMIAVVSLSSDAAKEVKKFEKRLKKEKSSGKI